MYRWASLGNDERLGQSAFNHLTETYPELADEIRGTEDDPFYVNTNIQAFLARVCAHLNKETT